MAYGIALGGGAWAAALGTRPAEERALPLHRTAAFKLSLAVTLLAFGMNWSATPYFYDVLHMHYGFGTTWNLRNVPLFLYLVTIAYFATYCALCAMAFRALHAVRVRWVRPAAWVVAPLASYNFV